MLVSFLVGLVGAFVASWLAYRTAIAVVQRRIQQAKSGSVVSLQIDEAVKVPVEVARMITTDGMPENTDWLNNIVERIFLGMRISETLPQRVSEQINAELQTKTSKIVTRLHMKSFGIGDHAPEIKGVHLTRSENPDKADLNVCFHCFYIGKLSMVIEATLQLPGVGSVNVSVSCQIKEITGKMRLQFYTTDQLYCSLCFLEQPNMRLDISVNDKNQALVEQQIRKAIRGALTKALVYPSVKIFPLQHALKEDAKKAKKKRFAIGLAAADRNGLSDPYCKVTVGRVEKKTRIIYRNLNPTWDQSFTFDIKENDVDVKLRVYDWDKYSKDDFLGMIIVPLPSLPDDQRLVITRDLLPEGRKTGDIRIKGTLTVAFTYQRLTGDAKRAAEESAAAEADGAEARRAAPKKVDYVVGLVVSSAAGLIAKDSNGFSDPYCVASIGNRTKATPWLKKTLSPRWDHRMTFDIKDPNEDLVLTLFDHDYAFSDDFLGYARITLSTLPLGRLTPLTLPLSARTEGEEVAGTVTVKVVVEQIPAGTFPAWSNNFIAAKYAPSNMGGTMISAMENEEEYDGEDGDGGSSVYDGADEEDESMDEQQPEKRPARLALRRLEALRDGESDAGSLDSESTTSSSSSTLYKGKIHYVNGHYFRATHFHVIKSCNVCRKAMLGIGKQGYQCQQCGYRCHKKCHEEANTCSASPSSP